MHHDTPPRSRAHPPFSGRIGRQRSVVVALALAACTSCSGAAPPPPDATPTCSAEIAQRPETVVIAATATSAEPSVELPPGLRSQLASTALRGVETCVSIATPQDRLLAFDLTPRRPSGEIENGPTRAAKTNLNLDALAAELANLAQTADGLDPLAALDRSVRLHPRPGTLYLISSAVATTAPVDLRELGWDLDPQSQAAGLSRAGWLPALAGWRVNLVGIGDVAGKQPEPTPPLRQFLRAWWLAICHASGAAQCIADPELLGGGAPRSRNDVPVVPLPQATVGRHSITLPAALLFPIDSAVIGHGADADLRGVVRNALDSRLRVNIAGHADGITGTRAHNIRLAEARADAVARRLVELGLPPDALGRVEGLGPDRAAVARERADPGQVSRDRKVEITFSEINRGQGDDNA